MAERGRAEDETSGAAGERRGREERWVRWLNEVGLEDAPDVGGKNASLGEMLRSLVDLGVRVPEGFAVTADAYRLFVRHNQLDGVLREALKGLDPADVADLTARSERIRAAFAAGELPPAVAAEAGAAYRELSMRCCQEEAFVAVRSSATAEDLVDASFAGQHESFLYVEGEQALQARIKECFGSLFTPRAISYRERVGYDHLDVALSVGVQRMVHADEACSGVLFTCDPESGFRDVVYVTSTYGLGESLVQGRVQPDAFWVHKPTLRAGYPSILRRVRGSKEQRLAYDPGRRTLRDRQVPDAERRRLSLTDAEVLQLARWALVIEDHYGKGASRPMDVEWAKDALTGELFVVQARPETVHGSRLAGERGPVLRLYHLRERSDVLSEGLAVGDAIGVGRPRVVADPRQPGAFQPGDVLVTEITDPDWEPLMRQAAAVVTERGGRTSHAAIVARELGVPAVVGAAGARRALADREGPVTVCCAEGEVGRAYAGALAFDVEEVDPASLPRPRTRMLLNVADPERAFHAAQLPNDGVGLVRMEFVFASWAKVHPLALTRYFELPDEVRRQVDALVEGAPSRQEYLINRLAEGIATLAAAFYPRPVILRLSDFKTNEYANLLGGRQFEPQEENPMLGWRGASRYTHPGYRDGFALEVEAIRRVRVDLGLRNLTVMVPFCRTPAEGRKVIAALAEGGLVQGEDGLEVYVMAEVPSNVLQAEAFADVFDGFSIGSNDLTQLVLGVDRDSERVASLFDERDGAVRRACAMLIEAAHRKGRKVGICGQAPSDHPDFAAFLVEHGIDSISLTPDAIVATTRRVAEAEEGLVRSSRRLAG